MQEPKPPRQAGTVKHVPLREWPSVKYLSKFYAYIVLWGFIALLSSSRFPFALGLFFFFTDDDFIEWSLRKLGVRIVPDTLGPEFMKAFVFFLGLWCLLRYGSAPKWLLSWLPPVDPSWFFVSLAAFAIAVIKIISAALVKKLLPHYGIAIAPDRQDQAILGFTGLGLALLVSIAMVSDRLAGH